MRNIRKTALVSMAIVTLATGTALADIRATATTDLNIRTGPGPQFPAVGVIDSGATATVQGCAQDSKWCLVAYNGESGWSYSDYLAGDFSGEQVVVTERMNTETVPVVEYKDNGEGVVVGAAGGAITGALIGGPVGAAIGGVAGAGIGAAVSPPTEVRTYVAENKVEPVYLEGEVVVGAGIPDNIELRPIPEYEYNYVYVNGQPVLVDPASRKIVYVYR